MKFLKLIGSATMVAAVVMAVGAATSSATVFCKNNASTETCSEKYPVGTKSVASSEGSSVIETTGGTVLNTCTSATAEGELTSAGGSSSTVKGIATSLTWGGCTKTTDTISLGEGEVHWISGTDNGTATAKGGGVTTNGPFGSCVYGLGSEMKDWGAFVEGEPPSMSINSIVFKVSGAATCPAEVRVTGKAILTSPSVGYVAAG
jgi:hypothetical protein